MHGIAFAALGRVPLSDEFELLGKLGWLNGNVTYHERVTGMPGFGSMPSDSQNYPAVDVGVGLGRRFASHWEVQLWWDKYFNATKDYYGNSYAVVDRHFDVQGYSLGVQYHF